MLTRVQTQVEIRKTKKDLAYARWKHRVADKKILRIEKMKFRTLVKFLEKQHGHIPLDRIAELKEAEIAHLRWSGSLGLQIRRLELRLAALQKKRMVPFVRTPRLKRELARLA